MKVVKPKTVKEELGLIQRVINTCIIDWGVKIPGNANPVSLIRKPKVADARDRRLSEAEYQVISKVPLFSFAIETAMRRGEIAAMRWEHVDLKRGLLNIPLTKTDKARTIPLSDLAMQILQSLPRNLNGQVWNWNADYITREFIKLTRREGYQDLRFHDLRHEGTSRLFEKHLNPVEVASITGLQDTRMLMRYTHLKPETLLAKINR